MNIVNNHNKGNQNTLNTLINCKDEPGHLKNQSVYRHSYSNSNTSKDINNNNQSRYQRYQQYHNQQQYKQSYSSLQKNQKGLTMIINNNNINNKLQYNGIQQLNLTPNRINKNIHVMPGSSGSSIIVNNMILNNNDMKASQISNNSNILSNNQTNNVQNNTLKLISNNNTNFKNQNINKTPNRVNNNNYNYKIQQNINNNQYVQSFASIKQCIIKENKQNMISNHPHSPTLSHKNIIKNNGFPFPTSNTNINQKQKQKQKEKQRTPYHGTSIKNLNHSPYIVKNNNYGLANQNQYHNVQQFNTQQQNYVRKPIFNSPSHYPNFNTQKNEESAIIATPRTPVNFKHNNNHYQNETGARSRFITQPISNHKQNRENSDNNSNCWKQQQSHTCMSCHNDAHYKSATSCKYFCAQCAIQQMIKGVKLIEKPKSKKNIIDKNVHKMDKNQKQVQVIQKVIKNQDNVQSQTNKEIQIKQCEELIQTKYTKIVVSQIHQIPIQNVSQTQKEENLKNIENKHQTSGKLKKSNQDNNKQDIVILTQRQKQNYQIQKLNQIQSESQSQSQNIKLLIQQKKHLHLDLKQNQVQKNNQNQQSQNSSHSNQSNPHNISNTSMISEISSDNQTQHQTSIRSSCLPSRQQQITNFLNLIKKQHNKINQVLDKDFLLVDKKIKNNFGQRRDLLHTHYQKIEKMLKQSLQLDLQFLQEEQNTLYENLKNKKIKHQKDLKKLDGIKNDIQPNFQRIVQGVQDAKYKQFMLRYHAEYQKIHNFRENSRKQNKRLIQGINLSKEACYEKDLYEPLMYRIYGGEKFQKSKFLTQNQTVNNIHQNNKQHKKDQNNDDFDKNFKSHKNSQSKLQNTNYYNNNNNIESNGIFFSFQKKRRDKQNHNYQN